MSTFLLFSEAGQSNTSLKVKRHQGYLRLTAITQLVLPTAI
jgi:hypothetical protein